MSGKTVLVTGGNGFVGSFLIRRLIDMGAEVTAIVPPGGDLWRWQRLGISLEPTRIDLRDTAALSSFARSCRPEIVFALAVDRGQNKWTDALHLNALSTLALMETLDRAHLYRFLTLGTSLEAARAPDTVPVTQHGASKAAALQILQSFATAHSVPFSPLRTYCVYGPLQNGEKLVPKAIRCAIEGEQLALTVGQIGKRYVHVEDVVSGCLAVLEQEPQPLRVQEIVTGDAVSNSELVELIEQITGRPITLSAEEFPARSWDREEWTVPSPDADILQGWTPDWDLRRGLESCVDAIEAQRV